MKRLCILVPSLLLTVACSSDDGDSSTGGSASAGTGSGGSGGASTGSGGSGSGNATAGSGTSAGSGSAGSAGTAGANSGTWELRIDNHPLSTAETDYVCFEWTVPLDQATHITGFTPFLDNSLYVHHYVVTTIPEPTGQQGYSCFDLDGDLTWVWTPGVDDFSYPDEVGLLVGENSDSVTFRVQVHYNNPLGTAGQVDSSGLDVHWTTDLRPNNAGSLVVGQVSGFTIPPGDPAYEVEVRCSALQSQTILNGPIQVFGSSLHAHEIGSVLSAEHWKNGMMVEEFNRDDPYSFENQNYKPADLTISPGDEIVTRCFFDSTGRTEPTQAGEGTLDEMCWDTILYYPRENVSFAYCGPL